MKVSELRAALEHMRPDDEVVVPVEVMGGQSGEERRRMSEWRPIETAPKDGTRVLVGRFAPDRYKREGTIAVDYWHTGARNDFVGWGKFNMHHWPPTHWMPLPDPPAKETK